MMELGLLMISIVIMFIIVLFWMVDRSNLISKIYKYERKISYMERKRERDIDKAINEPLQYTRGLIKGLMER